jgi:hypothetical protein
MQLDLFVSPPQGNLMTPLCFRDYKQYSEWLYYARNAKESCTICEDCLPDYEKKMKKEGRCNKEWYSVQLLMRGRTLPIHPEQCKVTKEIEHDKLYWEFFQGEDTRPIDKPRSSVFDQEYSSTTYRAYPQLST